MHCVLRGFAVVAFVFFLKEFNYNFLMVYSSMAAGCETFL